MAANRKYSLPLFVILIALFLPMIAAYKKYAMRESDEDTEYNNPDLAGLVLSDKPEFSWADWFHGTFQTETDDYNSDRWAFKGTMVRLNNQFYYDAFNQLRVNGFVSGKEDYVFSEGYIFSAFGDDLVEEKKVSALLEKAKVVQDTLKKKGIDLLLVFAPGKGMGCKEFIEDKYVHPVKLTNHDQFVSQSKRLGLNYLDLYSDFEDLKAKAPYPLFPKFGHHWSFYGECLAVDTIIRHIEKLHNCDMPNAAWNSIDVSDSARSRDADILNSMNLYSEPAQNMKLAYPVIGFEDDSLKNRTRVLTVSDSYWYGPVYMGVGFHAFAHGEFWYYNNRVVPTRDPNYKTEVWQLDLKQEIESNQVIMLLYADGNLPDFGSGFIQNAYELYTSPATYYARQERNKQIQTYAKQIRENPGLLKKATRKSADMQIPLDSAIRLDAMSMAGLLITK